MNTPTRHSNSGSDFRTDPDYTDHPINVTTHVNPSEKTPKSDTTKINFAVFDYNKNTEIAISMKSSSDEDKKFKYKLSCSNALKLKQLLELELLKPKDTSNEEKILIFLPDKNAKTFMKRDLIILNHDDLIPIYVDTISAKTSALASAFASAVTPNILKKKVNGNITDKTKDGYIHIIDYNSDPKIFYIILASHDIKSTPKHIEVPFNEMILKNKDEKKGKEKKECVYLTKKATLLTFGDHKIFIRHFQDVNDPGTMISGCDAFITCDEFKKLEDLAQKYTKEPLKNFTPGRVDSHIINVTYLNITVKILTHEGKKTDNISTIDIKEKTFSTHTLIHNMEKSHINFSNLCIYNDKDPKNYKPNEIPHVSCPLHK